MSKDLNKFVGLPRQIRIGPHHYKIQVVESVDDNDSLAHIDYGACAIRLRRNHPTPSYLVETVLHEITHGIIFNYRIKKKDKEERLTSTMGSAWTQVFQDNPALLKWLGKNLK